jgi:hypothetical protein
MTRTRSQASFPELPELVPKLLLGNALASKAPALRVQVPNAFPNSFPELPFDLLTVEMITEISKNNSVILLFTKNSCRIYK